MAFTSERDSSYVDKMVAIKRVAKVVKGGRRFAFSAIVVVGDENGRVGWGSGKAREVPEAMRKATDAAKRSMVRVPLRSGRTVHHDIDGYFRSAKVMIKPAKPGTGIIAGGPMRAIFEAMGIKDVVAKSRGSNNPYNMIQATFEAFSNIETPRSVAAKRGIKTSDLKLYREQFSDEDQQGMQQEAAAKPEKPKAPAKKAAGKKDAKKSSKPAKAKTEEKKSEVKAESKQDKLKQMAEDKPAKEAKAEKKKPADKSAEAKPAAAGEEESK